MGNWQWDSDNDEFYWNYGNGYGSPDLFPAPPSGHYKNVVGGLIIVYSDETGWVFSYEGSPIDGDVVWDEENQRWEFVPETPLSAP